MPSPAVPPSTIAYDLIFLSPTGANSYKLVRWENSTLQATTLVNEGSAGLSELTPSEVEQYSITDDGQQLVVTRRKWAGLYEMREIALLHLDTNQLVSLAQLEGYLRWALISPNGQWVAYVLDGVVYTLRTDTPGQRVKLGWCGKFECYSLSWSPNSASVAWTNRDGVWLAQPDKPGERLVAPDLLVPIRDETMAWYASPPWSLDSRYLLARAQDGFSEWYVIDTQGGHIGQLPVLPASYERSPQLVWLSDGRLFAVRSGDIQTNTPPFVEIWRIDPSSNTLLTLERSFSLPVSPETYPTAPTQLNDGRLAFVLVNRIDRDQGESGLYLVSLDSQVPARAQGPLPTGYDVDSANANWVPDGSGAIFYDRSIGALVYVSLNEAAGPSVPANSCCFTWTKQP